MSGNDMGGAQIIDEHQSPLTSAQANPPARPVAKPRRKARAFWMKQLHTWHWISAAVSLLGTLLFAITGLTLNHAASISAEPKVSERTATLAAPLLAQLNRAEAAKAAVPDAVASAIDDAVGLDTAGRAAEWSAQDVYVAMPGPGHDSWVSIDRKTGAVTSEHTTRGAVAYLNDLHKGRNSGAVWSLFLDVFSIGCVVFCVTGLILMQLHSHARKITWPLVGLGLIVPLLLALIFIH